MLRFYFQRFVDAKRNEPITFDSVFPTYSREALFKMLQNPEINKVENLINAVEYLGYKVSSVTMSVDKKKVLCRLSNGCVDKMYRNTVVYMIFRYEEV